MAFENLGFAIKQRPDGGGHFTPHAVVQCARLGCNNRWEKPAVGRVVPEMVAKAVIAAGWLTFDLDNRARARCPDCIATDIKKRAGESPGKKTVTIFGKEVPIPVALAVNSQPHAAVQAALAKPERTYRIEIQTTRPFPELANMISGFGEIRAFKEIMAAAVAAAPPEHRGPVPVAPVVEADVADFTPVIAITVPEEHQTHHEDGRRKMHYSPESMDRKRKQAAAAMARRKDTVLRTMTEVFLQDPDCTMQKMQKRLNSSGVKPPGRNFPGGWTQGQVEHYLPELGIELPSEAGPTVPVQSPFAPAVHVGAGSDD